MKYCLLFAAVLTLFACHTNKVTFVKSPPDDGKIEFQILQLNDIYEVSPLENGKRGGLARVATIDKRMNAQNPNTLQVVAGDFISPTLIGTLKLEGKSIRGKQMIDLMNAMGTDLVTFGNHEFDFEYDDLLDRMNESDFEWISSNVLYRQPDSMLNRFHRIVKAEKRYLPDHLVWQITDKDGTKARIGFFGVTLATFIKPYVHYEDFYLEARKAYQHLAGECDIVIGLTHLERIQDSLLAQQIQQVPLLIGGHDHTNMIFKSGMTTIAKADANAKTVYKHVFSLDKRSGQFQLSSELIQIDETVATDSATQALVEKWQTILQEKIKEFVADPNEVIFQALIPLDGLESSIRYRQTTLGNMIAKSMLESVDHSLNPQAAIMNSGGIRIDDMVAGTVTPIDVFRILPFGGPIFVTKMKGYLLKTVLNAGERSAGKGAYLQRFNLDFDSKSKQWLIAGTPVDEQTEYTIVVNDFLLKGMDIPELKTGVPGLGAITAPLPGSSAEDIRKAFIQLLKKSKGN